MHHPVLLQKVIENLDIKPGRLYIDATLGEGGYTLALLDKGAKVLALDWDRQQIENFKFQISNFKSNPKSKNLILKQGNFKDIEKIAKENDFYPVDGVVFDLGLSMAQINKSGRGFSYKKLGEPLDMRLSTDLKEKAADLINSLSLNDLYELFAKNSEELNSGTIARAIFNARSLKKIVSVSDLVEVIRRALGRDDEKVKTRIFQALRIAVNHEFDNLRKGLTGALRIIKKEGRIVVVTFHSLEDRIVKRLAKEKGLRFLTKKPIVGDRLWRFERSAKLRVMGYL